MTHSTLSFSNKNMARILCGLCLAVALLFPAAPGLAAGPADALVRAQQGIDSADSDLFNSAVDVNAVASSAADALMSAIRKQVAEGSISDSSVAMALALASAAEESGQAGFLRQMLVTEVRGFVAAGINGGYFAGSPNGTIKPSRGSLASALDKMPQGRRQLEAGKVLSEKDGKAVMQAVFIDPQAGRMPLELGLERNNGVWQVKELRNAKSLFDQAVRRAK